MDELPNSEEDQMAAAMALSLEFNNNNNNNNNNIEDTDLDRALQMSLTDNAPIPFKEMIARATQESLKDSAPQDQPLDDDLIRALEMSVQVDEEKETQLPLLEEQDTVFDPSVLQALAQSLEEAGNELFQEKMAAMMSAAGPLTPGRHRQCLEVAKNTGGLIVGLKFKNAKKINEKAGGNCTIRFLSQSRDCSVRGVDGDCLVIEADTAEAVQIAEQEVIEKAASLCLNSHTSTLKTAYPHTSTQHSSDLPDLQVVKRNVGKTHLHREARRHIFVDNSNLFIGAQSRDFARTHKMDYSIRVNAKKLASLMNNPSAISCKKGSDSGSTIAASDDPEVAVAVRVVAGSKPPASGAIWTHWQDAGFRVKVCSRDADTGHEDLVDDFLHAQMLDAVLTRSQAGDRPGENTLVMCTGDGNANSGYNNFYKVAVNAIQQLWRVEIWTWRHSCSKRFIKLAQTFPHSLVIRYLDSMEDQILFSSKMVSVPVPQEGNKSPTAKSSGDTPLTTTGSSNNVAENNKASDEEDDDANLCIICMEHPRSHAIIPCGHLTLCGVCSPSVADCCPYCRGPITGYLHVYRS